MWRSVLMLFCRSEPRPDAVLLVRDLDGYADRRAGIEQVRAGFSWPFVVLAATPQPEIEAYLHRVVAMGGGIVMPPTKGPGDITFALFSDPQGNVVGVVKGA